MNAITFDEAFDAIVDALRCRHAPMKYVTSGTANHNCDLWLPNLVPQVAPRYGYRVFDSHSVSNDDRRRFYLPFYDAAAELCRVAVLRPGHIASMGEQYPLSPGDGYSLTSFGKIWLEKHPKNIPRDPGQFMAVLQSFRQKLGPGFIQRADEAIRCYRTTNFSRRLRHVRGGGRVDPARDSRGEDRR